MKVFDGAKMREIRKNLKLTQYDLAPMTNITQNRISDIERNVTAPTIKEIDALSDALNINVSEFLNNETEIEVVVNTFTKKKKGTDKTEGFNGLKIDELSGQIDIFANEKYPVGRDLSGYVILKKETYISLIEDQEKFNKLKNILK
ncbi:helix-turn-helix domain-containing protein [Streptococcus agalactiae]|uniref:DNA-binding protein n=1 Tax=Streptococcus agalactiae TaxID=1311 RepID=A0A837L266_STRAG|nr:helix-turn-helix transcriptional regulator [Streptococcus agalactiae]KLL45470.1 DNA-binding protein [Streptococcus agalactiae]KLL82660.1 DNA-binding protein [Streptococcus agalactiae]HEN5913947.1 helix-turn-helix transcriptional regulator [Streptococcus agalactiae]